MISLISVGIKDCIDRSITEIVCAKEDAERVYSTFKYVLGDHFSDFSSISLVNARCDQFISLISGLSSALTDDDITIVYFSCHAIEDSNDLNLIFSDEDGAGRGMLSVSLLKSVLTKSKGEYVLIFDCCHSESALVMANKQAASNRNNISVIASTEYYLRAGFDEKGSFFTNSLCDAILQVFDAEEDITVNNIVAAIKKQNVSCYVNLSEGKADIQLKASTGGYDNFPRMFLSKMNTNNRHIREMMWYSINDIPAKESLEIVDGFIANSTTISEADWLVRRAIGSLLSNIKGNSNRINSITLMLLRSNNWMLQTIGLIASRNRVTSEIAEIQRKMIMDEDGLMSVVWLADLYFADSEYADLDISLQSNLAKTGWGLIQIWDRYYSKINTDDLINKIFCAIHDEDALCQLKLELLLRGIYDDQTLDPELVKKINKSKLVSILYNSSPRGRTIDKKKKWLFSMLYGNWRGQLSVNLDDFFNNTKEQKVIEELDLLQRVPSPEKRAALFSYFQHATSTFDKFRDYLLWGNTDPHPWVRREAVLAYKNDIKAIEYAFSDIIDRQLYIGTFDLILSSSRFVSKDFLRRYVDNYALTPCEKASLLQAISNE